MCRCKRLWLWLWLRLRHMHRAVTVRLEPRPTAGSTGKKNELVAQGVSLTSCRVLVRGGSVAAAVLLLARLGWVDWASTVSRGRAS